MDELVNRFEFYFGNRSHRAKLHDYFSREEISELINYYRNASYIGDYEFYFHMKTLTESDVETDKYIVERMGKQKKVKIFTYQAFLLLMNINLNH